MSPTSWNAEVMSVRSAVVSGQSVDDGHRRMIADTGCFAVVIRFVVAAACAFAAPILISDLAFAPALIDLAVEAAMVFEFSAKRTLL